ncbi:glutathione peroxidase [Anaerorhabdus sp.]|uniref:glutathione peroxidase n=1 Tax=Anaerorhabdus sp. TaxID=1872524 RepID=UPI002B1FAD65|nr:glutathione peroxidase [Anaerorhabdus sp.]MEA4875790.1 glutathione peroxidase [Anaerorhabdus sp.]
MTVYGFKVLTKTGEEKSLNDYNGKVLLIVNTATECGFTPQYKELEELYEKYNEKGLEILDFPCNQFGGQAPGTAEEIDEFCSLNFGTKFPRFAKIEVNGANATPLYKYLVSTKGFNGFNPKHKLTAVLEDMLGKVDPHFKKDPAIKWNFTKFLVDREGNVVERFEPTEDLSVVEEAIKKLI